MLQGHLGGSVVEHLSLAQGMILGSWDGVPHQAPRIKLPAGKLLLQRKNSACASDSLSDPFNDKKFGPFNSYRQVYASHQPRVTTREIYMTNIINSLLFSINLSHIFTFLEFAT